MNPIHWFMRLKRTNRIAAFLLIGTCFIYSCERTTEDTPGSLPPGFAEFYERFHQDTSFQMQHIAFPIPEKKPEPDTVGTPESQWTRDNWVLHRPITEAAEFERTFDVLTDELIVETIRHIEQNYAIQRRYALTNEGWSLVYYKIATPQD